MNEYEATVDPSASWPKANERQRAFMLNLKSYGKGNQTSYFRVCEDLKDPELDPNFEFGRPPISPILLILHSTRQSTYFNFSEPSGTFLADGARWEPLVKKLLQRGANPLIGNEAINGNFLYFDGWSNNMGHKLLGILMEHEKQSGLPLRDSQGNTPLHMLAERDKRKAWTLMESFGLEDWASQINDQGDTPLHVAARDWLKKIVTPSGFVSRKKDKDEGHLFEFAQKMLAQGASLSDRNHAGESVAMLLSKTLKSGISKKELPSTLEAKIHSLVANEQLEAKTPPAAKPWRKPGMRL